MPGAQAPGFPGLVGTLRAELRTLPDDPLGVDHFDGSPSVTPAPVIVLDAGCSQDS